MVSRPGRALLLGCATLTTAALVASLSASPAQAGDTTGTFSLTGGGLSITVPVSVGLGSAATGSGSMSGQLGTVTVTDARGNVSATWTAVVSSTDWTTGAGGAAETVAKASVNYAPGATTASSPVGGVFTPGVTGALGSPRTAYSAVAVGNNSASWNPTLTVTLPAQAVAGSYTGTITHSVS